MASLYQKSGKLYISIYHNGRRVTQATGLEDTKKNRKLVQNNLLPNTVFKIQTGQIVLDKEEVKTVSYYAELFLETKKNYVKHTTYKRYQETINKYVLPVYGKSNIDSVRASMIKSYISHLLTKVSSASVAMIYDVINAIFNEALYDEVIRDNPCKFVKRPRKKSKGAKPFSEKEVKLLLANSSGWFQNFLALSFFTGMRTGEVLALQWDDIDFKEREISVTKTRSHGIITSTKTANSNRDIPIFDELIPYLENQYLITGNKSEYVFITKDDKPFRDSAKIRAFQWARLLEKSSLQYRRLYDTRATFATMILKTGKFSANVVAQLLGHADVSMLFTKYNKYIKGELRTIDKSLGCF